MSVNLMKSQYGLLILHAKQFVIIYKNAIFFFFPFFFFSYLVGFFMSKFK